MTRPQYQYVGFWVRVLATLIDLFLSTVIILPFALMFGPADYYSADAMRMGPFDFIVQILSAAVYIVCWLKFAGTPGKLLLNLKILDEASGNPIRVSQAVIRYLGYFVSGMAFFLGFIWIGFDPKKQGWHDKMAKTVVVKLIH
ncbi:putative RDD family membrane protein YckC [Acinetobacter calcoaceticus]|uniref:Putative RDD family membrane protein YckC n=1 Tax=Acinetobacter calcoaceticus TaxID=471 RepID=A0A4V2QZN3_ACICA|nr:putative RDD family membrane protein YckC [Acinetobacter calcoaceticus]